MRVAAKREMKCMSQLQCTTMHICEKQFSRKEFLDRHTFNVHLKQRQFTCQHCKKTYCTKK